MCGGTPRVAASIMPGPPPLQVVHPSSCATRFPRSLSRGIMMLSPDRTSIHIMPMHRGKAAGKVNVLKATTDSRQQLLLARSAACDIVWWMKHSSTQHSTQR